MTAALTTAAPQTPVPTEVAVRRVPLTRLTLVELRKLGDTKAGMWLLIVIGLATVVTSALMLGWAPEEEHTFSGFYTFGAVPATVLLPVLGILSVTSEWSQRTALATFTLVPARGRVMAAKLAAGVLIAIAATAAIVAVSALANIVGGALGGDGSWQIEGRLLAQGLLLNVIFILMGMGFGAVLQNSPLAIVTFLVLPTIWSVVGSTVTALGDVADWLDINTATGPLSTSDMTSGEFARLGVAVAVWVVLPLIAGTWRILRREVN